MSIKDVPKKLQPISCVKSTYQGDDESHNVLAGLKGMSKSFALRTFSFVHHFKLYDNKHKA